jgi:hypothetical protein
MASTKKTPKKTIKVEDEEKKKEKLGWWKCWDLALIALCGEMDLKFVKNDKKKG